jgi:hypothetical protein
MADCQYKDSDSDLDDEDHKTGVGDNSISSNALVSSESPYKPCGLKTN